jgi:hypothetical protein
MTIEPDSPEWNHMNEGIDATIDVMEKGIFETLFSLTNGVLLTNALQEMWEAAYEAGRYAMYNELKQEGLL